MAGISSKAAGKLESKNKFNGNKLESGEFSDGSGLEMYDFNARTYDQQIGRFLQIDPLVEKYYSQSVYNFGLNNPVLFNDISGMDVDPSQLKGKANVSALQNILSTKVGLKLIGQFMHKGQSLKITIDGETTTYNFNKEGGRANDNLVLISTVASVLNPEGQGNAGIPREAVTSETEKVGNKEIGEDARYDTRKGVSFNIFIEKELPEKNATSALAHELSVHVDPNTQRLGKINQQLIDGTLKPGTASYLKQLQNIQYSGGIDHQKLGQGLNSSYQNMSAQLDKLKNTTQYTELYKKDVKEHN